MRNRIERLRRWLLAGAGLLLAVLVAFIGSARYLRRHALAHLPSRLGIDVRSETNGFTYSQSLQGRTIYTIHAAKEIEHSNGKISLHDVTMVLYGRTGDRADMVYGNEFEYDQSAGVVRAIGLVHIDLGAAGSANSATAKALKTGEDAPESGPKLMHATTSGLVYLDKLGVAATSEAIDFQTGTMTGHAIGADYNTDTGMLLLHSAVTMNGVANGKPVNVVAAAAQLDNRGQRAVLTHARYVSGGESTEAAQATLHTRQDSSVERIEAEGGVKLEAHGGTLLSDRADVRTAVKNQPQDALFTGSVRYIADQPLHQLRGEAHEAHIAFGPDGEARHAVFSGTVHIVDRTRASDDVRQPWRVRDLTADHVDTSMVEVSKGRTELRDAEATGGARMVLVDNGSPTAKGRGTSEFDGDDLKVHLVAATDGSRGSHVETVSGRGHTVVRQTTTESVFQESTGDTLDAHFRPAAAPKPPANTKGHAGVADDLASAVQDGHVHVVRRVPAKVAGGVDDNQEATAARAVYEGDSNRLTLTGAVRVVDAERMLWAERVTMDRATGNAQADGGVKVSYLQPATGKPATGKPADAPEPVHVLADRAELNHADDVSTFFGHPVRMWQAGSQVQAPVIELRRKQKQMLAKGDSGASGQVLAILVNAKSARPEKPAAQTGAAKDASSVTRVRSTQLTYADDTRQARFTGAVEIVSGDETVRSREASAFLEPEQAPGAKVSPSAAGNAQPTTGTPLDGRIQRVVAEGAVEVNDPGRRATGDRLLYTAADGVFLLSGGRGITPKVLDVVRGTTVTATAFRFHSGDQSVEALSGIPENPEGQPVHTDTPVKR